MKNGIKRFRLWGRLLLPLLLFSVPVSALAESLSVTTETCQFLTRHFPKADVTYSPGTDVYGQPVVPADLPGGMKLDALKTLRLTIGPDLRQQLKLPDNAPFAINDAIVGTVTLDGETVLLNGQPVDDSDFQQNLAVLCLDNGTP
jgi:hypothetical protein